MGIARGPNLIKDNLVFGYDSNYGVADNYTATRFYKGKPVDNIATDPTFLNNTIGTYTSSAWGGDTGFGEFATNTSPDGGGLMYINNNTSTSAGGGGNYNDHDVNNFTLINGVTYTRSWWAKSNITQTINGHMLSINGGGNNTYILGDSTDLVAGEWQRVSHTFTYSGTSNLDWRFRSINYNQSKVYIANIQLEVGSNASPFTATSRSDTASLIDLKRTTDIDVSNISFDSTGQPEFDGSNDYIYIDEGILNVSSFTVEAIVNITSTGNYNKPIFTCGNLSSTGIWFLKHRSGLGNRLVMHGYDGVNPRIDVQSTNAVPDAENTHVAVTFNGTSYQIYINGVADGNSVSDNAIAASSDNYIGRQGSTYLLGDVPLLKIYNAALSAAEIKSNYNAYKNSFNI
jgi:hypothetical protein